MKNKLFINKKIWKEFSEEETETYIKNVFDYYRKNGFPYFDLSHEDIIKVYNKMINFDTDTLILENYTLKQVMHGLNLVNFYMPHMWDIDCNNFTSPMKCFNSDNMLEKAIRKRVKYGDNMSDAGMRKVLSYTHGTHRVSNFRPTIAKYIYDNYSGEGDVLDFSSGFGGRLLGALSSDKVKSYTGTDPATKTYKNLISFSSDLNHNKNVIIYNESFEDLKLSKKYDLSFSSPPYFNTEEYAHEDTQSFIRYKTKEEWKDLFLYVLINKNYNLIKDDGYFIINIANVKSYPELEKDTVDIALKTGFRLVKTYKMTLSSLMKNGFKYEPIFVFKKKKI